MKKLLNTLYIFTEDAYLSLNGENVVIWQNETKLGRIPLHTLESIISFSYKGASPALMGACAERHVSLSFFDRRGRFLASAVGPQRGNVILRKTQYKWSEDEGKSLAVSRSMIFGKLFNSRWVLERAVRDHGLRIDADTVKTASGNIASSARTVMECDSIASLRGIEGDAAAEYFGVFNELFLRDKADFHFSGRHKRPPTDPINAMLSLFYTVLARDCASALEGVGLDPYVGLMHADRPGRQSLAFDLMEELRPVLVDRFVISAVNNRVITPEYFFYRESSEVRITDDGRKKLFDAWQKKKKNQVTHPFLKEKIPWGLVPHIQALLLSRFMRGDLDGYPPFLWK